jgi:hypothetical protein
MRSRRCPWSLTPYPYWVIRRYDDAYIMSLVKLELNNTMLANDDGSLPLTPDRFADWLLINIPFEIQTVQKILSFPTTIQRCMCFDLNLPLCNDFLFQYVLSYLGFDVIKNSLVVIVLQIFARIVIYFQCLQQD